MKKKLISILLCLSVCFAFAGCMDEENDTVGSKDKWAIYWYLCGSDLESDGGFASTDLAEMMNTKLPEGVKIIIETGGASQWHTENINAEKLQRYVYDSNGLKLIEEKPLTNMGESNTLADFLGFAKKNYPAEKTAVLFWNHGGGSVAGAAFDDLHNGDSLTLDEMHKAFASTWDLAKEKQPIEMIGFDTCLMATVDVASTFSDIGKYLVASEELEPGNGWQYSSWTESLAKNPSMNGLELGKSICDTFYKGCEEVGTHENTTLSVTNLSKVADLVAAYDKFGSEALAAACENPGFFSQFARIAYNAENYGGNTDSQGYTNMVDLGHLARQSSELLPESSKAVLDALAKCVEYKINGKYRSESTGLSCYYSYNADVEDFQKYAKLGAGTAFKYYYSYGLTGELDEEGMKYVNALNFNELQQLKNLSTVKWDDKEVDVDNEGNSILNLGKEAGDVLASIGFQLYYADDENDTMFLLGSDNDITADWDNGVFKDNFRGVWGSIDGHIVYMDLCCEEDGYNLYSVPVLLNNEEYNLMVVYDFQSEQWIIQGAKKGIDDNGMADKELRKLKAGDKITTIHYVSSISGDDDLEAVSVETFDVTDKTAFAEIKLSDGKYIMMFDMQDNQGNSAYSQPVTFEIKNGEITTGV